jgi:hypothetical protein
MTNELNLNQEAPATHSSGKRMNEVACALFLIMTGSLWLAPAWAPEGAWLTGVGLILLGLNAGRRWRGLRVNTFGTVAGLAALVAGIGGIMGGRPAFVPLLLVFLGMAMIAKVAFMTKKPGGARNAGLGGTCR